MEEVVAEKKGVVLPELALAEHENAPVAARSLAELHLVEHGVFDVRFPADAVGAVAGCRLPRETEPVGGRAQDHAVLRAGVEQDADLLSVDLAVDDQAAAVRLHAPFADLHQLAVRSGEERRGAHRQRKHDQDMDRATHYSLQHSRRLWPAR